MIITVIRKADGAVSVFKDLSFEDKGAYVVVGDGWNKMVFHKGSFKIVVEP